MAKSYSYRFKNIKLLEGEPFHFKTDKKSERLNKSPKMISSRRRIQFLQISRGSKKKFLHLEKFKEGF